MSMQPSKLSGTAQRFFKLIEFDENEELICEIRKHPFGLFVIYLMGTLVTIVLFFLLALGPIFLSGDPLGTGTDVTNFKRVVVLLGIALTFLSVAATAIGAYLYTSSVVLVTSEKIAQVLYITIFNRKISQLSIGDVQDVTVFQKGIFARLFNFGTLVIETAGEQENYKFTFTPHPYESAKAIVGAHERDVASHGN